MVLTAQRRLSQASAAMLKSYASVVDPGASSESLDRFMAPPTLPVHKGEGRMDSWSVEDVALWIQGLGPAIAALKLGALDGPGLLKLVEDTERFEQASGAAARNSAARHTHTPTWRALWWWTAGGSGAHAARAHPERRQEAARQGG